MPYKMGSVNLRVQQFVIAYMSIRWWRFAALYIDRGMRLETGRV
jgi:hypothetical protein